MLFINKKKFSKNKLFLLAWNDTLAIAARILKTSGKLDEALAAAIEHLKETDWYHSLSAKQKRWAVSDLETDIKEKELQLKNLKEQDTRLYDGKYEFIKKLGEGGFGRVFLAKDIVSERLVAIKQLNNQDKQQQQDIIHEIQMVAQFNHPYIVTFYHHFWKDELLYLVMEYCAQGNVYDVMKQNKITFGAAFQWILNLSDTLSFVHSKDIIHHDIKPANILFTEEGAIKISDFGIANTGGGTRAYMSPELFQWSAKDDDPRTDIYSLGVTLMEIVAKNPFFTLSKEQIIALHDKNDFPIKQLPNWQQEIILKAINKVPELRFQSMNDFSEAIKSKQVPFVLDKENLKAGDFAAKAEKSLNSKQWLRARYYLEFAEKNFSPNVNIYRVAGKFYLMSHKIPLAKQYYEKALKLNPRLDVQKDLGWINLELENYPTAISLLSDHLHRNPSDYEAYNLLLQCFYETGRYEAAMQLAKTLMDVMPDIPCFANNYYVSTVMQNIGQTILPNSVMKVRDNAFIDYNMSVVLESDKSHSLDKKPTLKSKLLFRDYRFAGNLAKNFSLEITDKRKKVPEEYTQPIIKIGRKEFGSNDISFPGTAISRRHCIIVNTKNDVMLYDLESTGTYVNGERVNKKIALIGLNKIRISDFELIVNTDKAKLL